MLKNPQQQSSNLVIKCYLPYFGLSFKDESVLKSHTTEPLCCISLIECNVSNRISYASFTFDKFKSWLNKYLKSCIQTLFNKLYHKLTINIILSTPCPFESAVLCQSSETCRCHLADFYKSREKYFCRFWEKQCMHLHESSTLPHFDIRIVICQMLLTIKLCDSFNEFKFYVTCLYESLISNSDQETHLSDFFHLDNISALKNCIRNHYKMRFERMTLQEKVQSSDLYFEINILYSWLNLRCDLNKFMQDMYTQIEKESFPKVSIVNSSLVYSDSNYMCIYQRFHDSLYFLYEKRQPFEAVIQFSKFCVLFLKKRRHILPNLHCLLMWIEFFMTVSYMLLMRHCRITVVLPSTHISSTNFIDTLQLRFSEKLQDILNSSHMWLCLKLLERRVAKMINFIFGDSIFQCLERDVNSRKLAKRIFILGLCYVHCFSDPPFESIPDLKFLMKCENVTTLVEDPSLRVNDICRLIAINEGDACRLIKDTIKVLMMTPQYKISRYYWMFRNRKPSGLQVVPDKSLTIEMDEPSLTVVSESDSQITESMVEALISNEEKDKKYHLEMQKKAVQVIIDTYRRFRNILLKKLESLEIPVGLPVISPSEEYCSICAVSFSSKQWTTPFKIKVTNNGTNSSGEEETLFKHLKKPAHSAKTLEFKTFAKLYETRFLPVKENAKIYSDLDSASGDDQMKFFSNSLKSKLQEFDRNMDEICQNVNWTETKKLEMLAGNIEYFTERIIQFTRTNR